MLSLTLLSKICYIVLILFTLFSIYTKYVLKKDFAKYFVLSSLCFLVGIYLIHQRYQISDFFSIVVANSIICLGEIYLYLATKNLLGYKNSWKFRYLVPIAIVFLGFAIFTYIYYDISMRTLIFGTYICFYNGAISWFFYNKKNSFNILNKISAIIFFLGCLIFVIFTISSLFINLSSSYFGNKSFIMYIPYLCLLLFLFWLMFIISLYSKGRSK